MWLRARACCHWYCHLRWLAGWLAGWLADWLARKPSEVDASAVVLAPSRFDKLMQMENKMGGGGEGSGKRGSGGGGAGSGGGLSRLMLKSAKKKKKKKDGTSGSGVEGGFLDNFGVAIYAAMKEDKERGKLRRVEAEQSQNKQTASTLVNRLLHLINEDAGGEGNGKDKNKKKKKNNNNKSDGSTNASSRPRNKEPEIVWEADERAKAASGGGGGGGGSDDGSNTALVAVPQRNDSDVAALPNIHGRSGGGSGGGGGGGDGTLVGVDTAGDDATTATGSSSGGKPAKEGPNKTRPRSRSPSPSSKGGGGGGGGGRPSAFEASMEPKDTPEEQMKDLLDELNVAVRALQRLCVVAVIVGLASALLCG